MEGVDEYEVERRVADDAWQPVEGGSPTPFARLISLADVPELASCAFRVRAMQATGPSRWSNEVSVVRPIRRPSSVTTDASTYGASLTGPVTVRWTNASQIATDVLLERTLRDGPVAWVGLPGATLAAGVYVDHLVEEGAAYRYRVRVGTGGTWSEPVAAWTYPIALAAPWDLEAEWVTSGVRLSWTNQSATATATTISYSVDDGFSWARVDLAGVPSEWLHEPRPIWPATTYRVAVHRDSVWATSQVASLPPFTIAGPPTLAGSATRLPHGEWAARDAAGRFHLAELRSRDAVVHRATATGHEPHVIPDVRWLLDPGVAIDATGHPHVVAEEDTGELVHHRWDGSQWDAEVVRTGVTTSGTGSFALGSGDAVHVLYSRSVDVLHLVREGGTTTETLVDPAPDALFWRKALGASADGSVVVAQAAHAFTMNEDLLAVSIRSTDGDWVHDVVTTTACALPATLAIAAGTQGDVALACERSKHDVRVVRRTGGTWSAPELVLADGSVNGWEKLVFAGSPDLGRLVLSATTAGGVTKLFVRGNSGWDGVAVGPTAAPTWVGIGAAGAWALYRNGWSAEGAPVPYSLFEEP